MATQWKMSSYMKGAAMLTIAALLVKVLSAVYRVPFQNMVGDEGFYIYQQIYPLIGMITTWTSVGFAIALAKLLSDYTAREDVESVQKVKRVGFFYIGTISIVFFLLLALSAPILAEAMGDPRLSRLIQIGAVVILAMPFLALLKSIYQVTERLSPLAYAQVVEQAVRVGFILVGAHFVLSFTGDLYATGAMALLGATVGEVAGILLLGFWLTAKERNVWQKSTSTVSTRSIIRDLTVISISASISSLFFLMLQLVDSMTVLNTLIGNGMALQEAKETKGIYDRVQPLIQMGIVVSTSLAFALVPLIASKMQQNTGRGAIPFIRLSYRVALVFGSAAALGLVVTMPYVNEMLFQTRDLSTVLMVGSVQVLWLSLLLLFMSILQGAGRIWRPTAWLAIGVGVKLSANLWFVGEFGILGAALSGNLAMLIALFGVTFELKRTWPNALAPLTFYLHLGGALLAMAVAVIGFARIADAVILDALPSRIQAMAIALIGVGIGVGVFLSLLMKLQLLQPKEWYLLPFGRRLAYLQLWLTRKKG
ncbi:oligosaccharide flippase family protein [Chryseomicrobium palamuruense]|uniref:Oligosaccharide flippase family protein n=1 Tax=Chryseomicrobium palamuruense TaxID=682973 RepID=A0ABV8UWT8_9BACL